MNRVLIFIIMISLLALSGCDDHDHESAHVDAASDYERGEHNGRMLHEGKFAIELAIFETGVPPEFRAWASEDGEPVPPGKVVLNVRLIRLGGEDDIRFQPNGDHLRGDTTIYEPHSFAVAVTASYEGTSYQWSYDSFEGRTRIEPAVAESFGLATEPAGPATIRQHVHSYGQVSVDPERERRITARFEGLVKEVRVSVGDTVSKGQPLLTIESNDSLQTYTVPAPVGGVVVHREVNPGEQSGTRELLRITDHSMVWVLLKVFPKDLNQVRVGQQVIVLDAADTELGKGIVGWLSPARNTDQSVDARVIMDNSDGLLNPGQLVQGEIEVAAFEVPLAVQRSGLQGFRDFTVVYARFGDQYEVRMLELGRQGRELVEVLGGIEPGVPYVTTNSYLVKADIEKSGASHDH